MHTPTGRIIIIWDAPDTDFEPDYTMDYVYAAFGDSLVILETGNLPEVDDRLLTYAALWYAAYEGQSLRYVGAEDPRLQNVG